MAQATVWTQLDLSNRFSLRIVAIVFVVRELTEGAGLYSTDRVEFDTANALRLGWQGKAHASKEITEKGYCRIKTERDCEFTWDDHSAVFFYRQIN